ncbi:MAG: efflux RND transporter periplasmic adaptor subunit [Porticoccaceae bacterium]|jgi:cobalt-zinc-cadmium efflux system membrane fusion protein|nr:efflux RND transporter periplasmic adaptor subunit [Porticoccaceae bacterium]
MIPRLACLILFTLLLSACGAPADHHDDDGAAASGDYERGPHGGRLLRNGDFALEVTIFESGVPPQYRLYAYRDDQPLAADQVRATVELGRLGGRTDTFAFRPEGDVLIGDGVVVEPHSFDVRVEAREGGREHRWEYASYEGRTTIAPDIAESMGLRTELAGPATLRERLTLMGTVVMNQDRVARVRAPFPGAVREVRVSAGDRVEKGQVLAMVQASDSLRTYPLNAPLTGVVTARNTSVGDVAGSEVMFEVADLSEVWVDLHAFGGDLPRLAVGQAVTLGTTVGDMSAEATLDALLPVATPGSQTVVARVELANPEGLWRPGLAVRGEVTVDEYQVPLAVRTGALQPFRDFTVVYAQVGDTYEVRMLDLGRRDSDYVEVLGGLEPGTRYVTEQSFLIRADIEKSGASHDH